MLLQPDCVSEVFPQDSACVSKTRSCRTSGFTYRFFTAGLTPSAVSSRSFCSVDFIFTSARFFGSVGYDLPLYVRIIDRNAAGSRSLATVQLPCSRLGTVLRGLHSQHGALCPASALRAGRGNAAFGA